MKKLMTIIAAAAMSFGLFAESVIHHTVDFVDVPDGTYDISGDAHWGYTGSADELQIKSEQLEIKTGSKVLSRYFINNAEAASITDDGLFFDAQIDFKGQALEELPTVGDDAKLGLFILDTSDIEGINPALVGTNLYLIAGYGNGGKALYQLTTPINDAFNAMPHRVTIKAYNSALSSGARAGFMLYLDGEGDTAATPLDARYVYVADGDGNFNLNNPVAVDLAEDGYLGGVTVAPALAGWAKGYQLFLSLNADDNQTLASVDFVGNATLDDITLTDRGFEFIPADASAMKVELEGGATIAAVSSDVTYDSTTGTITVPNGITEFTITPNFTKEITSVTVGGEEIEGEEGDYTITFVKDATITIKQADKVAEIDIGGEITKYETLADAITAISSADEATLKLFEGGTIDCLYTIGSNITIDLNGKILTGTGADGMPQVIYVTAGKTTIIDSGVGGKVVASGEGVVAALCEIGAELDITAGTYDGDVVANSEEETSGTIIATAGSFKKSDTMTKAAVTAFIDTENYEVADDDEYWTVVYAPKTYVAQICMVKYETIEEAVAAANAAEAGATIKLLADCEIAKTDTVTAGDPKFALVFSKDVTLTADTPCTLTGPSGQYGIFVGDNATLTLGANVTVKADDGTSHTILNIGWAEDDSWTKSAGYFVLAGGTISGVTKGGNAIAAQAGKVTINSGSITNIGSRGVKAEFNATAEINGGIIGDVNMNKAALYAANAGVITVNGGTINGTIGKKTSDDKDPTYEFTGSITIPGTSTATFDRDQTEFCAEGWGTKLDSDTDRYGLWERYTITFTVGDVVETNKIFKGDAVAHADPAASEGYSFTGWQPAIVTPAAANADYVAQFTATQYAVKFEKAGSEEGDPITDIPYTVETKILTAPECTWTLTDYTFDGWTNTVAGGAVYAAGADLPKTIGGYTLTATWKANAQPTRPTPIEGGDEEQKKAYDDWKSKTAGDVTGLTDAQIVDRFVMNVPANTTDEQLAAKADEELESIADAALKAIMAGETPDLSALKAKYPNATIELVVSDKLTSTDTAKFFQLKFSFTSKN